MAQNTTETRSPMRGRRIEMGLSLRDLETRCAELGVPVTNSQLSKIERGMTKDPHPKTRAVLKRIFGHDLIGADDVPAATGGES